MDLAKSFYIDKELAEEGVWVTLDEESALLIGSTQSQRFKSLAAKLSRKSKVISKHLNDIPKNDLIELIPDGLLFNWKGIKDEGQIVEYSRQSAINMLKKYSQFLELVLELSGQNETFRRQEIEEDKELLKKS